MEREIHKVDKYLLRTGILLLAVALLGNACSAGSTLFEVVYEDLDGTIRTVYHWRALETLHTIRAQYPDAIAIEQHAAGGRGFWRWMLAAAVAMVAAGVYLHRRENRAVLMWNHLEGGVEVSVRELCESTGITREDVAATLSLINAQPNAHYVWDRESDRIVDGRLRNQFVVLEQCGSCGAHVDEKIPLDLTVSPVCRYCGAGASSEYVNRLKQEALTAIRSEKAPGKPSPFSPVVFLILLVVFWPGAAGYALWKAGLLDRVLEGAR